MIDLIIVATTDGWDFRYLIGGLWVGFFGLLIWGALGGPGLLDHTPDHTQPPEPDEVDGQEDTPPPGLSLVE